MNYLRFIRDNRRFLGFGFLLAALSGYGQTYLISLFGGEMREAFALSNGEFGLIYSTATLISGVSLIWLGRLLDRVDLRWFAATVLLGAFLGCLVLAGAQGALTLGLAFLLLRVCGQGLMMHTAQTTMARYFREGRGTAISIATLGLPFGEGVFPVVLVAVAGWLGWRGTWLGMGAVLVVAVLPLALWLLRGHDERVAAHRAREASEGCGDDGRAHWRRRDMLRDPRFYGVLPAVMAPPFIMTALFFHQVPLAAEKGWTLAWLASSFSAFAVTHVAALMLAGPLVDRVGAQHLLAVFLAPLALGLVVLVTGESRWAAPLYLGCAGLSMGVAGTLMGALWAELYGTRHLGAIRALVQAVMVLATALAPGLLGGLLDAGVTVTGAAGFLLAWVVLASVLAGVTVRRSAVRYA